MNRKIVEQIQKICDDTKKNMNINDIVIRDDVFLLLQESDCTVLYYPLPNEAISGNEGCAGCHIEKLVNGRPRQFVFINTSNTRERQAFSVAHELGHILCIDQRIYDIFPECRDSVSEEDIVNRFAAELLMPEQEFKTVLKERLKAIDYDGEKIMVSQLVEISAYMMNYFFVPFKSVIRRYQEIGRLKEQDVDRLNKYNDSQFLREIIKAKQYTRLLIVNEEKSMDNLQELLFRADRQNVLNGNLASRLRDEFDLANDPENTEEGEDTALNF